MWAIMLSVVVTVFAMVFDIALQQRSNIFRICLKNALEIKLTRKYLPN